MSTRGTGAASSAATPPRGDAPWRDALRLLREAAALHACGRLAKHGTAGGGGQGRGTERQRALGLFQWAAMVDAGLMCWEEGRRGEAVGYYQRAAELGHPVGMCNLVNFAVLEDRISLINQLEASSQFPADDLGLILESLAVSWDDSACSGVSHCMLHKSILQVALKCSYVDTTGCLGQFLTLGAKLLLTFSNGVLLHRICQLYFWPAHGVGNISYGLSNLLMNLKRSKKSTPDYFQRQNGTCELQREGMYELEYCGGYIDY